MKNALFFEDILASHGESACATSVRFLMHKHKIDHTELKDHDLDSLTHLVAPYKSWVEPLAVWMDEQGMQWHIRKAGTNAYIQRNDVPVMDMVTLHGLSCGLRQKTFEDNTKEPKWAQEAFQHWCRVDPMCREGKARWQAFRHVWMGSLLRLSPKIFSFPACSNSLVGRIAPQEAHCIALLDDLLGASLTQVATRRGGHLLSYFHRLPRSS